MKSSIRTCVGISLLAVLLAAAPAFAKCTVTLKLKNSNDKKITVLGNDSQARVNGGLWSKMGFHNTVIKPGETADVPWTTNMKCGGSAKRDLRFKYQEPNNSVFEEMVENIDISDGGTVKATLKH
jgi:hypothetical protein